MKKEQENKNEHEHNGEGSRDGTNGQGSVSQGSNGSESNGSGNNGPGGRSGEHYTRYERATSQSGMTRTPVEMACGAQLDAHIDQLLRRSSIADVKEPGQQRVYKSSLLYPDADRVLSSSELAAMHTEFQMVTKELHDYVGRFHPPVPQKKKHIEETIRTVPVEKTYRNVWGMIGPKTKQVLVQVEHMVDVEVPRTTQQSREELERLTNTWLNKARNYEMRLSTIIHQYLDPTLTRIKGVKQTYLEEEHRAKKASYEQASCVEDCLATMEKLREAMSVLNKTDDLLPKYMQQLDAVRAKEICAGAAAAIHVKELREKQEYLSELRNYERGLFVTRTKILTFLTSLKESIRQVDMRQQTLAPIETIINTAKGLHDLIESGSGDIIALSNYLGRSAGTLFQRIAAADAPAVPVVGGAAVNEGVVAGEQAIRDAYLHVRDEIFRNYAPGEQGGGAPIPKAP